jgi:hypothetical protein
MAELPEADQYPELTDTPKKRKRKERSTTLQKKERASNHISGPPCGCKRLNCFHCISEDERAELLKYFNNLGDHSLQNAHLAPFISMSNTSTNAASRRTHSFEYHIPIVREGAILYVQICQNALISIFGITPKRLQTIQTALKKTGVPPVDQRGKHTNRPRAEELDMERELIIAHIKSLRCVQSHYSLNEAKRLYLPAELDIPKLFALFKERNPLSTAEEHTYREVFNTRFNISFGKTKGDTCATCDKFMVEIESLSDEINNCSSRQKRRKLCRDQTTLKLEHKEHKIEANTFYDLCAKEQQKDRDDETHHTVMFDYGKKKYTPNLQTNITYYNSQLGVQLFVIHTVYGTHFLR